MALMPSKSPARLRAFVRWLKRQPNLRVEARLGGPAPRHLLRDADVPPDLRRVYREMNGASIRWAFVNDPEVGGSFKLPSLGRNLRGWTRSDFFTDDEERPRHMRIPDEIPLRSRYFFRPCWWSAEEELLMMWETSGDTCGDVGLTGFDDYVARGIEDLFCSEWTSLMSGSQLAQERADAIRAKLGIKKGWSDSLIRRADRLAKARNDRAPKASPTLRTFASLFPASGRFTSKKGTPAWRIRGSGVSGPPETAETTKAVVAFLEQAGVNVVRSGFGGIGGADMFTLDAPFLDGGLFAQTGSYFYQSKSAFVAGARAVLFVALGLGLSVPSGFLEEQGSPTLEELTRELRRR